MLITQKWLKGSILILALLLSACSHHGPQKPQVHKKKWIFSATEEEQIAQAIDGDGPPDDDIDIMHIPNAVPKLEPLSRYGNPNKYEVFGKHYTTLANSNGYAAEGKASWYGRKFHGKRTSSGEPYDMFGMTAAHRSLPLPTYAKVENLHNGKEVIVKINDRGPFVKDRLIDLSYAAAKKLGIHAAGTGKVRITAIDPVVWHKQQKAETRLAKANTKSTKQKSTKADKASAATLAKADVKKTSKSATTTLAKADTKATSAISTAKSDKATKAKAADKPKESATKVATAKKQIYVQLGSFSKKTNAQQLADKATTLTAALTNADVRIHEGKLSNKNSYRVRVGPLKDEKVAQTLQKKLVALNGATPKVIYE